LKKREKDNSLAQMRGIHDNLKTWKSKYNDCSTAPSPCHA